MLAMISFFEKRFTDYFALSVYISPGIAMFVSSAVYSILVPSPNTYLEYQIILDQVAELNDDFDRTVSKLKERYEARDFRELDCLLGGWTFPRAYPEYQSLSNQAAELAKGFEGTESKLRKCSAARDFRVLSRLLESWTFPRTYPEYQSYSNEALLGCRAGCKHSW